MSYAASLVIVLVLAAVTVLGDYFLKLASEQSAALGNRWFVFGTACYAATAAGWVLVMRSMHLAEIAVFFSLSTMLMLAALGWLVFGETPSVREVVGIGFAVLSIIIMVRSFD